MSSSQLRYLVIFTTVICLMQTSLSTVVWAEGDDGAPQGQHDRTTALANGLTATTRAQFSHGALQITTNVQIPVPGVLETRSDGTTDTQMRPSRTTPGSTPRVSIPPRIIPDGQNTTPAPPCCANFVLGGGPLSFDTGPNGTQNSFGGFAIGGFDFVNITPGVTLAGGQTTPWRAIGRVIQIDPRTLALNVENQLGFPPIALKANPDP